MLFSIGFVVFWVFVFGLLQWAFGGDGLWQIFRIRRKMQREGQALTVREKERAAKEVRRLENLTDRTLRASMKAIAFVTMCAWVAVGVTFLLDAFGVNWAHHVFSRATFYWRAETSEFGGGNHARSEVLRNMGRMMKR